MKFSQAMAKLEENRELKFKDQYGIIASLNKDGYLVLERNGVKKSLDLLLKVASSRRLPADDWELIQEPVDFTTAIKSGERIKYIEWGQYESADDAFYKLHNSNVHVLKDAIMGKWFIEC